MPKPAPHTAAKPHTALGVISGAVFMLALAAGPMLGARLVHDMSAAGAFSFTASEATMRATRRALDSAAADLTADSPDRISAWNDMIARELAEGDASAARGLMLAAGPIAGPEADAVAQAREDQGDDAALAAARPLLAPANVRQAAEAGMLSAPESAPIAAAGDARDLAVQARSWLDGRGAALSELVLTGVSVSAPELGAQFGVSPAALQSGVVTLKAALRSDRLSPAFLEGIEARLQAVGADGHLEQRLREGLGSDAALADEPGAARAAFVGAVTPTPEWRAVADLLLTIDALNTSLSWTGAVVILAQAETIEDMPRLQLLAQARGESAAALAKRMDDPAAFLSLARPSFEASPMIQALMALLGLSLAAIVLAPGVTLAHAVLQIWSSGGERRAPPNVRRHPGRQGQDSPRERLAA
jgi:hypothetical protein